MIPHSAMQLHTDVSGLLSTCLHSLSFGGSLHCSPMDAWKLKTRKVQEVSMEKAEVELDTENFMEEEGGEKNHTELAPCFCSRHSAGEKVNKTVLWVALLINLNSVLALPFELNLIIAYLPAFLLFVQILQAGIFQVNQSASVLREITFVGIKTTGPTLQSLYQQVKST